MRFGAYTAVSGLAAGAVVLSSFAHRPNFYSAAVHLSQTSAYVMILLNFLFVAFIIFLHVLQLALFGRLRGSEVEQLYDKSWYAVTETLLAMSIFREDFDVKFLLLFAVLLGAKCFHWLNASRVDYMDQNPPVSPAVYHARIIASFILLFSVDAFMIYNSALAVLAVLPLGRPNIMVMFAFEFTILFISSIATAGKYILGLTEKYILRQEAARRKLERAAERERSRQERLAAGETLSDEVEEEEEDEEWENELGGWEERAQWTFGLDLVTDLLKLLSYIAFFAVVVRSYGVPLHILRDVYVTVRSFVSKIRDFIRYRRAMAQMNLRYPDATAEELERDDVCIICREQIKVPNAAPIIGPDGQPQPAPPVVQNQRTRAKKLPCGHIFHFACLRGWLERQSRCPTCRRPLLDEPANANNQPNGVAQNGGAVPNRPAVRQFQFGGQFAGFRFEFGQGQDAANALLEAHRQAVQRRAGAGVGVNAAGAAGVAGVAGAAGAQPAPGAAPGVAPTPGAENAPASDTQAGTPAPGTTPATPSAAATALPDPEFHQYSDAQLQSLEALRRQVLDIQRSTLQTLNTIQTQINGRLTGQLNDLSTRLGTASSSSAAPAAASSSSTNNTNTNTIPTIQTGAYTAASPLPTTSENTVPTGFTVPEGWTILPLNPVATRTNQPATPGPHTPQPQTQPQTQPPAPTPTTSQPSPAEQFLLSHFSTVLTSSTAAFTSSLEALRALPSDTRTSLLSHLPTETSDIITNALLATDPATRASYFAPLITQLETLFTFLTAGESEDLSLHTLSEDEELHPFLTTLVARSPPYNRMAQYKRERVAGVEELLKRVLTRGEGVEELRENWGWNAAVAKMILDMVKVEAEGRQGLEWDSDE
ncbi:hypothetical protein BJ508DRAFT_418036 [Ascobolus immersus RN42]|uniref:RING-type E3 ubiquitin transferase n=1 Tax=Ascobolus immersus RN42 TaxID=1160509 RepID=A0A3N4I168_ASCIM|nr:hypothetical protein BJ508DRAFT_418036 [Ascobolus immersus RN42]